MAIKVTHMSSIPRDEDSFTGQVRTSISKVANLCGWSREEREYLMGTVDGNPEVVRQWKRLQRQAEATDTVPVWEWNKFVRRATDRLVEGFYNPIDKPIF